MADVTTERPAPLKRLDRALGALRALGLVKAAPAEAPVVALLDRVAAYDPDAVTAIARTLAQATVFNEIVRDQLGGLELGDRYRAIAEAFDSIRDDARRMVEQVADGRLSGSERLSNLWMKVTRGDVPARFEKIKRTFVAVTDDAREQVERERRILDAYGDFRGALKEAEILGFRVLDAAGKALEAAKAALQRAAAALEKAAPRAATPTPKEAEARARLELTRDTALRALQDEDQRYQIAKDVAENLSVGYHTSEVIMGRLHQVTDAKERVYRQAVTFFGTNETVLTALSASFTGLHGLHESTQTVEAMKRGVAQGLETLGDEGTRIQEAALRAGYGPTIRAESVRKLVEAVVAYQERSKSIVAEMRALATKNEEELRAAVEDGRRRLVALEQRAGAAPSPVASTAAPGGSTTV